MKRTRAWVVVPAVLAVAIVSWQEVDGRGTNDDAVLNYTTSCNIVPPAGVDGRVTNQSADVYQVRGNVLFSFSDPGSTSHEDIPAFGNGVIAAGMTETVAHVTVPFAIGNDKVCSFTVTGAIKSLPK